MPYETTEKDFKEFKKECDKWIKYFGISGYEIIYDHDDFEPTARAYCWYKHTARIARIGLTDSWSEEPRPNEIRRCAFHEVCELLLMRLRVIAEDRAFCGEDLEEEIHRVIRILENTVFK